jgi:hypothetical protein
MHRMLKCFDYYYSGGPVSPASPLTPPALVIDLEDGPAAIEPPPQAAQAVIDSAANLDEENRADIITQSVIVADDVMDQQPPVGDGGSDAIEDYGQLLSDTEESPQISPNLDSAQAAASGAQSPMQLEGAMASAAPGKSLLFCT